MTSAMIAVLRRWALVWLVLSGAALIGASASASPRSNLSETFECATAALPDALVGGVSLIPTRFVELEDGHMLVTGALGWHTTWAVLFDLNSDTLNAYETFGVENANPFGRMEVPPELIAALQSCGAIWHGPWDGAFPKVRPVLEAPLLFDPSPRVLDPLIDLLPPEQ